LKEGLGRPSIFDIARRADQERWIFKEYMEQDFATPRSEEQRFFFVDEIGIPS